MINANDKLKHDNVGTGTTVSIKHIKLKPNTSLIWKNWEGFKVFTTSVNDIESIEVIKPDQSIMILVPKTETVTITCKSSTFDKNSTMKLYGVKITQFLIMTSIATTGHKIQGCSKDALIINTFGYGFSNWIYVALSLVRKFSDLFLLKKLDFKKLKPLDKNLLNEDNRLLKNGGTDNQRY